MARARASPHGSIRRPSGKSQREGPASNPGEEVTLRVRAQVGRDDVLDASLVDVSGGKKSVGDELAEPCSGARVELVVVGESIHHLAALIEPPPGSANT